MSEATWRDRAEKAEAILAEVRALHARDGDRVDCVVCERWWPCTTIEVLDGATVAEIIEKYQ